MAKRMPVSYTGPREDVSLKALRGLGPDIGDIYIVAFLSDASLRLKYELI